MAVAGKELVALEWQKHHSLFVQTEQSAGFSCDNMTGSPTLLYHEFNLVYDER
jgi:hypothetical protein